MIKIQIPDFSIEQIANSGQCFRINQLDGDNLWQVVAFGKILKIQQINTNEVIFHCSEEEYLDLWKNYFDLDRDYKKIKMLILNTGDPYLIKAVKYGYGLRILKQDIWEVIVSFVISQRNNISRIKRIIENLCMPYGVKFPSPSILAKFSEKKFKTLGLGYRTKYLINIAHAVASGKFDVEYLKSLEYLEAIRYLKLLQGIGDKVANCIALFGLHKIEAFPIDVWIKRIIDRRYNGRFDLTPFFSYAGIIQQYMFFYERSLKI